MGFDGDPVRVLVIPGLHDSGPTHWQSWLQSRFRNSVRVEQADWSVPDLDAWADRIEATLAAQPPARWVAVAHSFGCLALARHLARRLPERGDGGVQAALLVAPADPNRFGLSGRLPTRDLGIESVLIASETDPWMAAPTARLWAGRWGARWINLGDAGHINVASGFGPLPPALTSTLRLIQHLERARRIERAHPLEYAFAI